MTQEEREARIASARRKPSPYLNAGEVAVITGDDSQCIRVKARNQALPYPAEITGKAGRRVKIYKQSFFEWYDKERGTC